MPLAPQRNMNESASQVTPRSDAQPLAEDDVASTRCEMQTEMRQLQTLLSQLQPLRSVAEQFQVLRGNLQELKASQEARDSTMLRCILQELKASLDPKPLDGSNKGDTSPAFLVGTLAALEKRMLTAQRGLVMEVTGLARSESPAKKRPQGRVAPGPPLATSHTSASGTTVRMGLRGAFEHGHSPSDSKPSLDQRVTTV
jgi:hypothetical protein